MTAPATILVVDDSALDRRLAGALIAKDPSLKVVYAKDGLEALAEIERERPAVVVTDLQMPGMNGLELVEAVRKRYPALPIVLMTAHGSEEIAMLALRTGAASYVPKRRLAEELVTIVRDLVSLRRVRRTSDPGAAGEPGPGEAGDAKRFSIGNDIGEATDFLAQVESDVARVGVSDETGAMQIGVALREALANAVFHGNLEVGSELLEHGGSAFSDLANERRRMEPYAARRVRIEARFSPGEVAFVIEDDGPGFDPGSLPDPLDLSNLEKPSGRGLMLIRTFMDEVTFNERGNQIRMVKRKV